MFGTNIRHSPLYIMFWLCLATCLHNILMNGANNVVISSLQKEFYLSSRETGIFVSVYDIGSLASSLFIPLMVNKVGKPKLIAFGMFMLFLGCMINVIPHRLRKSSVILSNDNSVEMCNYSLSIDTMRYTHNLLVNDTVVDSSGINQVIGFTGIFRLKHLLYLANIVNGLSSASVSSLLVSYIEDFSSKSMSSIYVAFYYAVGSIGLAIGFVITSLCLNFHTDIDRKNNYLPEWLNQDHPNWVGAWWLPYFGFGILSFFIAVILFFLPAIKPKENNNDQNEVEMTVRGEAPLNLKEIETNNELKYPVREEPREESNIMKGVEYIGSTFSLNQPTNNGSQPQKKKFFIRVLSLFKNPIYVCLIIATAIEGLLQNSFLAFAPLFLEYQYRLSSGNASFYLGALSIAPLLIGGLAGGVIASKYFGDDIKKFFKFLIFILIINTIVYAGFMLNCHEPTLISDNLKYAHPLKNSTQNCYLTASDCNCDPSVFKPICLNNSLDIIYQSPCFAGCSSFFKKNDNFKNDVYTNCTQSSCSSYFQDSFDSESHFFTDGFCPSKVCNNKMYVTYFCVALLMFLNAIIFTPYTSVLTKCFDKNDQEELNHIIHSFKQFSMNAIGTIPGPILFGSVIDLTCKYWHTDSFGQPVCKLYNNENFAYSFGLLGVGFKFACLILITICLFLAKRKSSN